MHTRARVLFALASDFLTLPKNGNCTIPRTGTRARRNKVIKFNDLGISSNGVRTGLYIDARRLANTDEALNVLRAHGAAQPTFGTDLAAC